MAAQKEMPLNPSTSEEKPKTDVCHSIKSVPQDKRTSITGRKLGEGEYWRAHVCCQWFHEGLVCSTVHWHVGQWENIA